MSPELIEILEDQSYFEIINLEKSNIFSIGMILI